MPLSRMKDVIMGFIFFVMIKTIDFFKFYSVTSTE